MTRIMRIARESLCWKMNSIGEKRSAAKGGGGGGVYGATHKSSQYVTD